VRRPEPFDEPIYVSRPMLPPLDDYVARLREVWDSRWLTNNGAQHQALEQALAQHLRAPHLSLFNNGTIALVVACQALRVAGEVITTPFTFPATPHVLSWNGVTPVFADIDPDTMNLDPAQIEPLITNRTSAILAVHVYGTPCDVSAIQAIADLYGLKVIYDGAHAFGTEIDGRPITAFGDATMLSFHATKLFHTGEGGALVVRDELMKRRVDLLKNFGIKNEAEVVMPGINGKMSELSAALGLANLEQLDVERAARAEVAAVYDERLAGLPGVRPLALPANVTNSYQYYVVRVTGGHSGNRRDALYEGLKAFNVFARRYFHPLCTEYSCYRSLPTADARRLPVAYQVASEVLTLPLWGALGKAGAHRVCDAIEHVLGE
jgi:dTDP-4-amino-4,6-dideoxygalactose transaminase